MRLTPKPYRKVAAALNKMGFEPVRQRGSHVLFRHADGRTTLVPHHYGEDIGPGLLRKIIRDTGVERDDFLRHL